LRHSHQNRQHQVLSRSYHFVVFSRSLRLLGYAGKAERPVSRDSIAVFD